MFCAVKSMKFILFIVYLIFLADINLVISLELLDLENTTVEKFPYQVAISGTMECPGILITENYVITRAICVEKASSVSVYLGFTNWPFSSNGLDKNTQTFVATDITIHEEFFTTVENKHYLNDLALIKLPQPAKLSSKVYPVKLVPKEDLLEQEFTVMSGWKPNEKNMQTKTIKILNQDTCSHYFGTQFLRSQELCAYSVSATGVYTGNAINLKGKVLGYLVKKYDCLNENSVCGSTEVIFNFVPFLDWISKNVNLSIAKLTGESKEDDTNVSQKKIENLENIIKEVKAKHERDITTIQENINNILTKIQQYENERINHVTKIDKKLDEVNNKIIVINKNQNNQQEKIDDFKIELTKILNKQNHIDKLEANLEKQLEQIHIMSKEIELLQGGINNTNMEHGQNITNIKENIKNIMVLLERGKERQINCDAEIDKQAEKNHIMSQEIQALNNTINKIMEYMDTPVVN